MRLIDADSAKLAVSDYKIFRCQLGGLMDVAEFIDDQTTINAVPVVRCRECKWWHEDDDIGHCDNPDGLDNYAKPEDFCSYGERKEGADNEP